MQKVDLRIRVVHRSKMSRVTMAGVISSIGSFVRTVALLAVAAILGYAGWFGYRTYYAHEMDIDRKNAELAAQQARISELNEQLEQKQRQVAKLETAIKLLKVDHRVAQMKVLDQRRDEQDQVIESTIEFVEVDDQGRPLVEPKQFTLEGDVAYVDAYVVKFGDQYVEGGDPLRSTSICLFRRIFGEHQKPQDGFVLDAVGSRPAAYSPGHDMSDLERTIWSDFWDYATDPAKARAAGVRAAHGEAPSIKLLKGKLYKVELRASGGLSIVTEDLPDGERSL